MKQAMLILFLAISSLATAQDYNGTWTSLGYGRLMTIQNDKFEIFDITDKSCIASMNGKLAELTDKIDLSGDTLSIKNGLNTYYFQRTNENLCNESATRKKSKDPVYNFEVLAATFKDHYAYFKERNIDWEKMYQKYRSKITAKTTKPELYLIVKTMLTEFNDEHISFSAPNKIVKKAATLADNSQIKKPKTKRIPSYKLAAQVANTYLGNVKSKRGGTIRWGVLANNIGYIQFTQMLGFGNYGINDDLSFADYWGKYLPKIARKSVIELTNDEHHGIAEIMDEVMADLGHTNGLMLDMRFNGGGKDEVGLEILSRLNPTKQQVGIKKAVHGTGFSPAVPIYIEGKKEAYTKPVCLLTSRASSSATEICVLAALSMDQVTSIGGNTKGITSDMLDKTLPNGWEFSLSNEIYLDNNGKSYEHSGIPPDFMIYESDTRTGQYQEIKNSLENKKDLAIEKALEILRSEK